jgi:hypothetical protein
MLCKDEGDCYKRKVKDDAYIMMKDCEQSCLPNCFSQFYSFDSQEFRGRNSRNIMTMLKNKEPDRVYVHIPEQPLIQFICDICSLAGMWVSVSLFGLFGDIIKGICYLVTKNMKH